MKCSRCGSTSLTRDAREIPQRYRQARTYEGVIFRRHRCMECGKLLTSIQKILDTGTAEDMEAAWLDAPAPPAVDVTNWSRYGREYSAGSTQDVADLADGGGQKVG